MAATIRLSQQHSCSLPDASRAPDRKDSTPRHGRLLNPSSWAERDDRDHAADNFFHGGSPKTGHPISPPGPPHRQKSFSDQISGDGAIDNGELSSPPSSEAANSLRKVLRAMMTHAIEIGLRADDSTRDVRAIRVKSDGFHSWTRMRSRNSRGVIR